LKALAAALVKAQLAAEAVGKDKANAFHKYRYASAEAMLAEGREALATCGLALFQKGWSVSPDKAMMSVQYMLIHDSGDTLEWNAETSIIPDKGRPQDKAEAAALTYSIAYTIRGLLLLPRVDEQASVDARDDRNHEPRRGPPVAVRRPYVSQTPHDSDGVVLGPMQLTEHAAAEQVLAAIHDCPQDQLAAVGKWIAAHGENYFPEDLASFREAFAIRRNPVRPVERPAADPTDDAIRAPRPLTTEEQAALDADADDTREP